MLVKKKIFLSILLIIAIFTSIIFLIPHTKEYVWGAEGATVLNSEAFEFIPSEEIDSNIYTNEEIGSKIRVTLTQDQISIIDEIRYFFVIINTTSDEITRDDNGKTYKNGAEIDIDDVIGGQKTYLIEEDIKKYDNPTIIKDSYFEVVANKWCALVIDIKYHSGTESNWSYHNENIYYITNIDNTAPKAYKNTPKFVNGGFEYKITIEDKDNNAITANSGLKSIDIRKETSLGEERLFYKDKDIDSISYYYNLFVNNDKAKYYAYLTDIVGNNSKILLANQDNYKYNDDFETVLINSYNDFIEVKDYYSQSSFKVFEDEFINYQILEQNYSDATTNEEKTQIESYLENQKKLLQALISDFDYYEDLRNLGQKDIEIIVANKEFLNGDIEILNSAESYTQLLYGDKAVFNFSVVDFDLDKIDKTPEIKASGIKNVNSVISITLNTNKVSEGDVDILFSKPLKIKIPLKDYKNISCVLEKNDSEGQKSFEKLNFKEYTSYIIVEMPQSKGVISLVLGNNDNKNLLWLLVLLVIPVSAGVFFIIKIINKKKKLKAIQIENAKLEETKKLEDSKKTKKVIPKNKKKK